MWSETDRTPGGTGLRGTERVGSALGWLLVTSAQDWIAGARPRTLPAAGYAIAALFFLKFFHIFPFTV